MTAVITTIAGLREKLAACRPGSLGLVPTMGALHAGHARLIEMARRECQTLVVSIFVNPLQFDRQDDLEGYPRPLDSDIAACSSMSVDLVFAPADREMYPAVPACSVDIARLADHLCGPHRPGHFRGVATVVLKLFNIVQPDRAYFGEKDAQQVAIVRRMVSDLNVPVTIVEVPTVRESDGLALSSRNQRLSRTERTLAPALYLALSEARNQISAGVREAKAVRRAAVEKLPEQVRLEYLEIVDPIELQPLEHIDGPARVAGAVWVGSTRLIDNLLCLPPAKGH